MTEENIRLWLREVLFVNSYFLHNTCNHVVTRLQMYIIYKSVMVLFIVSRTFFVDIYKFFIGFRNMSNIFYEFINITNTITKILQIKF